LSRGVLRLSFLCSRHDGSCGFVMNGCCLVIPLKISQMSKQEILRRTVLISIMALSCPLIRVATLYSAQYPLAIRSTRHDEVRLMSSSQHFQIQYGLQTSLMLSEENFISLAFLMLQVNPARRIEERDCTFVDFFFLPFSFAIILE
jgi:hypothetical protein